VINNKSHFFYCNFIRVARLISLRYPAEDSLHKNTMEFYCITTNAYQMINPDIISANAVSTTLTAVPTAKVIRHPRSKKAKEVPLNPQPDEETLLRLNAMARQYPFCILHRAKNTFLL